MTHPIKTACDLPKLFLFFLLIFSSGCALFEKPGNDIKVVKSPLGYELSVNGKPFYIQGVSVGYAFGKNGENYLAIAKELGANTVRTWGTDQGTQKYLDEAHRQGLYVAAGIWINYADERKTISYLTGRKYMEDKEQETLDYVRRFKKHPAVIAWGIGNECIFFTKNEEERASLCRFLENLIQKVHKLDPRHPVFYASVNSLDLPYLKKYVPSLDIIGMNVYGSVIGSQSGWEALRFGKPYMLTEFGPLGSWDLPKDNHGKVLELEDYAKAGQYKNHWSLLRERRGKNIGGFAHHLGETSQESLTMWNINDGIYKKESFLVLQKQYGAGDPGHAPRIRSFTGVPDTAAPGASFDVDISLRDPVAGPLSYEYEASTSTEDVLEYYVNERVPLVVRGTGPHVTIRVPENPGIYRIYCFVRDNKGRSSSTNRTIKVETKPATG